MLENFSMYSDWGMWFLQFAVGVIFIYHGWPKLKRMAKSSESESRSGPYFSSFSLGLSDFGKSFIFMVRFYLS